MKMKMKMIILTTILLVSFNGIMGLNVVSAEEQNDSNAMDIYKIIYPVDEEKEGNAEVIPFIDLLAGGIPLFYPPLELSGDVEQTYIVTEGDNLYRIALNYGIPLESLKAWNGLLNDLIHPGDELVIKGGEATDVIATAMMPEKVKVASIVPEQETKTEEIAKVETKPEKSAEIVSEKPVSTPVVSSPPSTGLEMTVTATAYTAYCKGCSGTTATGIDLRSNPERKVIAVDPSIIPLGTRVWVEGYGEAIAGDVGGAIKGHKIDVFIPSYESAMQWGVKKVKIKVLN
ncbi:3D domain-containing protein [Sporosarcina oncorhynchi]|uniref:3D domain-containing protein n=2 Tax=Sporosarcina oncorhynchi TaxID=3056444 RepID=A0ABZ0LB14_9BACL|nr:3D domain-containing protein [Sporosarcina sp. T2O-4]WOV89233.1 3D domain-containing protein [Sporosarcina sp. T2O-4]